MRSTLNLSFTMTDILLAEASASSPNIYPFILTGGMFLSPFTISSTLPLATIFPWSMTPILVHISESSGRICELITMVLPISFRSRSIFFISCLDLGSSSTRSSGSCMSALATQSLCFIPLERLSTNSSFLS